MKYLLIIGLIAIVLIMGGNNVYAKGGQGAYQSGFNHGCSDSHIENPSDRYINGVNSRGESTGPDHHTQAFMNGYYDGFKECGYDNGVLTQNTAVDDSFNNRDSVVQPQSQSANTNQIGQCPSQIINGDCYLGQSQSVDNNFAQASRANN